MGRGIGRKIIWHGLVVLIAGAVGCQEFSFSKFGGTDYPSDSVGNLAPTETAEAPSGQPSAEIHRPGELAADRGRLQPRDIYAPTPPPEKVHVVQKGETLFGLARKFYGNQRQWRRIYQANRNRIPDPQKIDTGMKLIIP